MWHFSVTPPLTIKGHEFHGLRGFAGKPFHPQLTDIPVAAFVLGALFDVLSLVLPGEHRTLGTELFDAATWVVVVGALVSLLAALSGWADWHRSSEPGTQVRRTINSPVWHVHERDVAARDKASGATAPTSSSASVSSSAGGPHR